MTVVLTAIHRAETGGKRLPSQEHKRNIDGTPVVNRVFLSGHHRRFAQKFSGVQRDSQSGRFWLIVGSSWAYLVPDYSVLPYEVPLAGATYCTQSTGYTCT